MVDPRLSIEVFAVAPEKLTFYLLNLHHQDGAAKAAFFIGRGFSKDRPDELRHALTEHGRTGDLDQVRRDDFGLIFSVNGGVMTPLSRAIHVRTIWAVRTSSASIADLVTAYPGSRV